MLHESKMYFTVQLRVLLFLTSAVLLWAQPEGDEPLCSSTAPVHSTCTPLAGADWVSGLTADTISFSVVTLSWTPHPLEPLNMQGTYEIWWRRFKEAPPLLEWRLSQQLNESIFNATSNTLSKTIDELQHNTPYEMRVCVSPAPNQTSDDPSPPECGYCTLCFQTKNASICLLRTIRRETSSEELTLTCEASSDPPSNIRWNALINGTRVPLKDNSDFSIDGSTNFQAVPPITISNLEYNPDNEEVMNPNCVIDNGFDILKIRYTSFTEESANSIELLSAMVEFRSEGVTRFTCEAASDPPSSITWDTRISDSTREALDGGTNPNYSISGSVDVEAMPPITVSYLEYNPDNVDFTVPDCFIRNGFDTLRVRNPSFTEVTPGPPTSGDISLVDARFELLTNGTNVYICEVTSSTTLEFTWEVRMEGSRVPLLTDNPNTPYVIVTDVDSTISPIFGSSRIFFSPNSVSFDDPECVVRNEMGSLLRVRMSEFILVPTDVNSVVVTLPLWAILLLVVLPFFVIASLVGMGIACKCLSIKREKRIIASSIEKMKNANDYTTSVPLKAVSNSDPDSSILYGPLETALPSHMIVPSSDIKVSTVIGQGEFGVVYKGTLNQNNHRELVAVKTLKGIFASAADIQSFTEEILILQQFNHPNVMSLIGVCLGADKVGGGPSIILPFMSKGSLLNFLRKEADRLRPSKDADVTQIGAVEKSLIQICLQVAKGMEYLASQRFVHRDLAARNCMIDQYNQIKVGDFGLSEDIYAKNYFRQTSSDGVKLPVKWMALESLKLGVFSEKSDVWSYGVTCWEVFSCGEIPYPGVHPQQVLELLEQGQRLRKPGNPACSYEMYSALLLCWEVNPDNRKTFTELCSIMEAQLHSMSDYLDLNLIANTQFSDTTAAVPEESPYEMADDSADREVPRSDSRAYDSVADDVHDSTSVDMLYERAPEDNTYIVV